MKKSFIRIFTIILLLVCFIFGTIFKENNSVDASTTYTYTYDGTNGTWDTTPTGTNDLYDSGVSFKFINTSSDKSFTVNVNATTYTVSPGNTKGPYTTAKNDTKMYKDSNKEAFYIFDPITISFDLNGGTGTTPTSITIWPNEIISVSEFPTSTNFSKDGSVFKGWSKDSNNDISKIISNADYPVTIFDYYESKTLYAVWGQPGGKITYNTNEGTMPEGWNTEYTAQTKLPDTLPIPTRDGCIFKGWFTDSTFNTSAVAGNPITSDTTLYAKWAYTYGTKGTDEYLEFDIPLDSTFTGGALTTGNYYFDEDITLTERIIIGANQTVNILFNGHTLNCNGVTTPIKSIGNLGLYDQHKGEMDYHYLHMFDVDTNGLAILNELTENENHINVYGGLITGIQSNNKDEYGIYCYEDEHGSCGSVTIKGITFVGNYSTYENVGIYIKDATSIKLDNIDFVYNFSEDKQGAGNNLFICIYSGYTNHPFVLDNITFKYNTVKRDETAINTSEEEVGLLIDIETKNMKCSGKETGIAVLNNITIEDNDIEHHDLKGLIYSRFATLEINTALFNHNIIISKQHNSDDGCSINGGFINTPQNVKLTNVDILNNTISSEYEIYGGLIYICSSLEGIGGLTLDNCKINENSITRINKMDFSHDSYGGFIYLNTYSKNTMYITNTTINKNTLDFEELTYGTLIYATNNDVEIASSSITNNNIDSDSYCGGILYTDQTLTVEGTSTNYININNNNFNKGKDTLALGQYSGLILKSGYTTTLRYININNNYVNYNLTDITTLGILMCSGFKNNTKDNTLTIESINIKNNTITTEESDNAIVCGYFIYGNLTSTLTNVSFDTNTIVACDCYAGGLFANEYYETEFINVSVNKLTVTMINEAEKYIGAGGSIVYGDDLKIDDESIFTNNNISTTTNYFGGLIYSSGVLSCHATITNNTISSSCVTFGSETKGGIIYAKDITSLEGSISNNTITSYLRNLGGLVYNEGSQNKATVIRQFTCEENEITIDFIGNSKNVLGGLLYSYNGSLSIHGNSSFSKNTIKITTNVLSYMSPFIYANVTLEVGDATFDYNDIDLINDHENVDSIGHTYGLFKCSILYINSNISFNNNDIYFERIYLEGGIGKADSSVSINPGANKITFNDNNIHSSNNGKSTISGGIIYTNNIFMNDSQDQTNDIEFTGNTIKANKSNINGGIIRLSSTNTINFAYIHDLTFDTNTISTNYGDIYGGVIFNQAGNKRLIIRKITITNNIFKDDHVRGLNDTETSGFYGTIKSDYDIEIYNALIESNEYDNFFTADGFGLNISNGILTVDTFDFNYNIIDVNKASALFIRIEDTTYTSVGATLKDVNVLDNNFTTHASMGTVNQNDLDCTSLINIYSNQTNHTFSINNLDIEGNTIDVNSKFGGFMYIYSSITIDGYKIKDNTVDSLPTSGIIFNDYNSIGSLNTIKNALVQGNSFTCKDLSYNTMFNSCSYVDLTNFEVLDNLFTIELSRDNINSMFNGGNVNKYYLFNIDTQSSLTNFKFNNNITTVTIFKGTNDGDPQLANSVESVFRFNNETSFDNVEFKSNTFNLYSLNNSFIHFGPTSYLSNDITLKLKDLTIFSNTIYTTYDEDNLSPIIYIPSPQSYNEIKTIVELSGLITVKSNLIDGKTIGLSPSISTKTYSCLKFNSSNELDSESQIDLMFNEFEDDYKKQLLFINGKDYIDIINVLNNRFYLSLNENDVYYSGRVESDPTKEVRKYVVYIDDLLTSGYTKTYKWYKGTSEVLNQNTFEFTSTAYVFGSFNCVLTLTKENANSMVFTSKVFALSPTIINNPSENNDFLFDVDLSKIEEAGVTVDYEWYKLDDQATSTGSEIFDNSLITTYNETTNIYYYTESGVSVLPICSSYDETKSCYKLVGSNDYLGISFTLEKGDCVIWNASGAVFTSGVFGEGTQANPSCINYLPYIYAQEDGTYWIVIYGTNVELYVYKYELAIEDANVQTYESGETFTIDGHDALISSIFDTETSMYYTSSGVQNSYFGITLELNRNDVLVFAPKLVYAEEAIVELYRIDEGFENAYYASVSLSSSSCLIPIPADGKYLLFAIYVDSDAFLNPGITIGVSHQDEYETVLSDADNDSELPITGKIDDNGIIERVGQSSYVGFDTYLEAGDTILVYYYDSECEGVIVVLYGEDNYTHTENAVLIMSSGCSLVFVAPNTGYYSFVAAEGEESLFGGEHLFALKFGGASYLKIENNKKSLSNEPSGKYYAKAIYTQGDETFTLKSSTFDFTSYTVTYEINETVTGSAPTDSKYYIAGDKAVVLSNTATRLGFKFDHWTDGVNNYNPGSKIILSSNITLTAVWTDQLNISINSDIKENGKPVVKTESTTGYTDNITVKVEVTVEANITATSNSIDYYNILKDSIKLSSKERVGIVYDVKLIRNGISIQPSELGENTYIRVKMLLPKEVDQNKLTRIIHVHNNNDIQSYVFDKSLVDSEGYFEIDVNRLSEFAFIYEVDEEKHIDFLQIILVILLVLLSLILIDLILYVTWKYSVLKVEEDSIADRYFRVNDNIIVKICRVFYKKDKLFTVHGTKEEQKLETI